MNDNGFKSFMLSSEDTPRGPHLVNPAGWSATGCPSSCWFLTAQACALSKIREQRPGGCGASWVLLWGL